jgi:hypothetical protein
MEFVNGLEECCCHPLGLGLPLILNQLPDFVCKDNTFTILSHSCFLFLNRLF